MNTLDLSLLSYDENMHALNTNTAQAILRVPIDADTEVEFKDVINRVFMFPHYTHSWDGIHEWMGTMDWIWGEEAEIPRKKIIILHSGLPRKIGKRALTYYLINLVDGAMNLKRFDVEVVPVFPQSVKEEIETLIRDYEKEQERLIQQS